MGSAIEVRALVPTVGVVAAVIVGFAVGTAPWLLWGESARPDVVVNRALLLGVAGLLLPILPAALVGGAGATYRKGALVVLVVGTAASIAFGFEFGAQPYAAGAAFDMHWVPAAVGMLLVPVGLGSLFGYALGAGARANGRA